MTQIKKDIEIRLKRFHLKLINSEIYILSKFHDYLCQHLANSLRNIMFFKY